MGNTVLNKIKYNLTVWRPKSLLWRNLSTYQRNWRWCSFGFFML